MAVKELQGLKIPNHVAIILDGNRRYAKERGLPTFEGHRKGAENVREMLKWAEEIGIKELTMYTFSVKNFKRSPEEVNYLFMLFKEFFKKFSESKEVHEKKVKIDFLGRIEMFPKDIQQMVAEIRKKTGSYDGCKVNFCFGYGGREEIADACKKIAEKVKAGTIKASDINENVLGQNMYFNDDVDLIIRTSGEHRTSDFLPWQGHYAEWFFIDNYWPAFSKRELIGIIKEFNERERRFGK